MNFVPIVCMLVGYCCACHMVHLFYAYLLIRDVSVRERSLRVGLKVAYPILGVVGYVIHNASE
jgi:hypothetical protein